MKIFAYATLLLSIFHSTEAVSFPKTGSALLEDALAYQEFLKYPDSIDEEVMVKAGYYLGFLDGLIEMAVLQQMSQRSPIFCLPNNVTVQQVEKLVFEFLSKGDYKTLEPIIPSLAAMLMRSYPCD